MVWLFSAAIVAGVYRSALFLIVVVVATVVRALVLRAAHAWLTVSLVVACATLGTLAVRHATIGQRDFTRAAERAGNRPVRLDGWVASFPQSGRYGSTFDFATRVDGRALRVSMRAQRFDVAYGERLVIDARLVQSSRLSPEYFLARGLAGEARASFGDMERLSGENGCPLLRAVFWPMHRGARTRLARALGADAALPVGLLLGERGMLDRAAYESVRKLGIAHLLALSGMHLTMIAGLAVLLARGAARHRDAFAAIAVSIYVGVVGDIDSLTRAYLMVLLIVCARAWVRPARPIDALGKALLLMLLYRPCTILSVGLQLSFVATLAVLVCLERMPTRFSRPPTGRLAVPRRCAQGVAAAFLVSLCVEAFIAPLQVHHFGRVSVVGPLATVVFLAPVTLLQGLALAASPGIPVAGGALSDVLGWTSIAAREAVVAAASWAPDLVVLPRPYAPLYYASIAVVCAHPRRPWSWWVAAIGVALSFVGRAL